MALKKSVQDLCGRAKKYEANEKIALAVTALVALGESATHSNTEFKKLKALVETAEAEQENGAGEAGDATQDDQKQENSVDKNAGGDENSTEYETPKVERPKEDKKPKKKLSMAGIKMIGSKFYSKKDNYKTGFNTANECAEKHNKEDR